MSYNTDTTWCTIEFMGREFQAEINYEITDYGGKAIIDYNNGGDPGWGPEWEIDSITLSEYREDEDRDYLGPGFEATGKLLLELCLSEEINDAVAEAINNR